ncbi:MAG: sigma-70 family RNA polymerase sigma factor [Planctomycetes bacterium]|nr:sigma-70 family RNA polymerase sigma factor [Planctomycetota bacterium]
MAPRRLPDTLIASHAGALRALAIDVAADRDEAADIEQETWLRALVAPPSSFERFGGWLATVARGFASKRRRSAGRRREHERAYAAQRSLEHADDPTHADTLRAVIEALFALDEPYRRTVFQRYFEDLSPRELAEREGVALATIESRLQRAHVKLRVALERRLGSRDGGARRALLAFAGLDGSTRAALGGALVGLTGVGLVSLKTKIVVAAAVGLLAWLGWQRLADHGAPAAPAASVAAETKSDVRSLDTPPIAHAAPYSSERAAIGAEASASEPTTEAPVPLAAGPYVFALDVAPLDEHERPLAHVDVYLAPEGRPFSRIGNTDWTGHLRVKWRAFAPSFDALLAAERTGFGRAPLRRVRLQAGEPNEFSPALVQSHGAVRNAVGFALVGGNDGTFEISLRDPNALTDLEWAPDELGNAVFEDPWITPASATPMSIAAGSHQLLGEIDYMSGGMISFEQVLSVEGGPAEVDEAPAVQIAVVALDASGAPLADARVTVTAAASDTRTDGKTDAEGRYTARVPPGALEITVGGLDRPLARKRFEVEAGATVEWNATLYAERALSGSLATPNGTPLAGWTIEVLDSYTKNCVALCTTDDQGKFRCGHAPIASVALVARNPDGGTRFVALRSVLPSNLDDALELRVDPRTAKIAFELVDDDGAPIRDAQVRVLFGDDGFGARVERQDHDEGGAEPSSTWTTPPLAPGGWELEVGGPARGWRKLGNFQLVAGEVLELGKLRWTPPSIELRAEGDARTAVSARLETVAGGVRVRSHAFQSELPVSLPIDGETWSLNWRAAPLAEGASAAGELPFGAPRTVSLDARARRELVLAPTSGEHR